MTGQALLRTTLALGLLGFVTGCAEMEPPVTSAPAPAPTPPQGYWNGDGVPGSPKIIVSLSEQRAYFFKGKHLVGETTVSTGKPGFSTPPGQYTVLSKDATHVSTVFGDYVDDFGNVTKSNIDVRKDSKPPGSHYDGARMPFAMFFRGGYAMHQGYVPPYAASHGCIRIPQSMAETFFNAASVGTPVIVKQEAVMHSVPAPAVDVEAPPAPYLVRSTGPASVRPATVRTTVPPPIPVRSPAPMLLRAPGSIPSPTPVRSQAAGPYRNPSPVPLRSPSPAPLRSSALVPVRSPSPIPVRSKASALSRTPGPVRSPAPVLYRSPAPIQTPVPLQTPAPLRSPGPASVHPSPTPRHSRAPGPVRPRASVRLPAPSPTPTPTPRR